MRVRGGYGAIDGATHHCFPEIMMHTLQACGGRTFPGIGFGFDNNVSLTQPS